MGVTAGSGSLVVTVGEIFPWLSVQAEGEQRSFPGKIEME